MKNALTSRWAVVAITLVAAGLRFFQLGAKSFWFDESFTYTVTLVPIQDSVAALSLAGIYTPFYFLLLRPVVVVGATFVVYFLWSKGWSPQWQTLLFPLLLLALPLRRSVLFIFALLLVDLVHMWWERPAEALT